MFLFEIKILPTTIKKYEIQNNTKTKSSMNLDDFLEKYKIVFNETYKLTVLSITIPVTSATCERIFSCLRKLKNHMRNCMSNDRLVSFSSIFIEKKIAKSLDPDEFVNIFSIKHKNR
jgi:hypothetical protein